MFNYQNKETKSLASSRSADNNSPLVILTTINGTEILKNRINNFPQNISLKNLAKEKRQAGILSEVLFWQQVNKAGFHKIDFDRQKIIGNYIVDFYIKNLGLIIEIDGTSHDHKEQYDADREKYFFSLGLKVYRILDWDVKRHISTVMMGLEDFIIQQFGSKN